MVSILASIKIPTLVMGGEASPVWMHHAVEVTANHIHGAQSQILEGQKARRRSKSDRAGIIKVL